MIKFLLQELEKVPQPIFSKNELLAISEEQFRDLCKKKVLVFQRPKDSSIDKIHYPRCPHGCYLSVMEFNGRLEAVCEDHPEEDPIPISEDHLLRYAFSVENLLKLIAQVNELQGSLQEIEGGFFYMGWKKLRGVKSSFFMMLSPQKLKVLTIEGIKSIYGKDNISIILSPITRIGHSKFGIETTQGEIIFSTLNEWLDPNNLSLDFTAINRYVDELKLQKTGERYTHSADFRSVYVDGVLFALSPHQAQIIQILWGHWEQKTPDVEQDYILEEIGSKNKRLRNYFRNNTAWGTLIVPGERKGTFRLKI